jgi:hypothetical protein
LVTATFGVTFAVQSIPADANNEEKGMKGKVIHWSTLAFLLISQLVPAQTVQSPKLDEKASAAVLSLKKLQSRAEIGADYQSFSSALADAYFSVKMFQESKQAEGAPEFSNALRDSITWYKTAQDVMNAMHSSLERVGIVFCDRDNGPRLCQLHPELVEWRTRPDGSQSGSIDNGLERSLKIAGENLEKADRYLAAH